MIEVHIELLMLAIILLCVFKAGYLIGFQKGHRAGTEDTLLAVQWGLLKGKEANSNGCKEE